MNGKEDLENLILGIRHAVQSFAIKSIEEGKTIPEIKQQAEMYYGDYLGNISCSEMIPIFAEDAIRAYEYPPREQLELGLDIEIM